MVNPPCKRAVLYENQEFRTLGIDPRAHPSGSCLLLGAQAGREAVRQNSPTTTSRLPRRCWPTQTSASPKLRSASASHRRRSIGTSRPREPRIRRAFDNGRSTPKTGRSRRVSARRRAAALRRYRAFGVLRAVLLRPGGGTPANKIVVKVKSNFHLPVLELVPLSSCSGSRRAR
jgi:hypothetical protein